MVEVKKPVLLHLVSFAREPEGRLGYYPRGQFLRYGHFLATLELCSKGSILGELYLQVNIITEDFQGHFPRLERTLWLGL